MVDVGKIVVVFVLMLVLLKADFGKVHRMLIIPEIAIVAAAALLYLPW